MQSMQERFCNWDKESKYFDNKSLYIRRTIYAKVMDVDYGQLEADG